MRYFLRKFLVLIFLLSFLFLQLKEEGWAFDSQKELNYLSQKNLKRVKKFLKDYNHYWKVSSQRKKDEIKLFDAFTLDGKFFRLSSLLKKKVIVIIFSDDLNLDLTFFWLNKKALFLAENPNLFSFLIVLEPTLPYYQLYKHGYEMALKKHIKKIERILRRKVGTKLFKRFQEVPQYWFFDYRMEIAKVYGVMTQRYKAKNAVFVYNKEGKLEAEYTGKEKNFPDVVFELFLNLLKRYGYRIENDGN